MSGCAGPQDDAAAMRDTIVDMVALIEEGRPRELVNAYFWPDTVRRWQQEGVLDPYLRDFEHREARSLHAALVLCHDLEPVPTGDPDRWRFVPEDGLGPFELRRQGGRWYWVPEAAARQ